MYPVTQIISTIRKWESWKHIVGNVGNKRRLWNPVTAAAAAATAATAEAPEAVGCCAIMHGIPPIFCVSNNVGSRDGDGGGDGRYGGFGEEYNDNDDNDEDGVMVPTTMVLVLVVASCCKHVVVDGKEKE
ncbi:hypothetical protein M0802_005759 [Mischocyttarus mexicanus]|nr:hypothetical protein M0802_005759 [Mischocyttarus mexicanus]